LKSKDNLNHQGTKFTKKDKNKADFKTIFKDFVFRRSW